MLKKIDYKGIIISFLFAIGFSFSFLSCFGMQRAFPLAFFYISFVLLYIRLYQAVKGYRIYMLIFLAAVFLLLLISGALYSFVYSSIQMFKALAILLSGNNNVFLAYWHNFAIIIAIISALIAHALCDEDISFVPMLLLLSLMLYIIVQINSGLNYLYSFPAWLALGLKAIIHNKSFNRQAIISVLAITIIAFLILPFSMHSIKPLNTLAKDIKQRVRDYLFFTEEREVFSIENYGFYPNGTEHFGGKVTINNSPVMIVKTPRRTLLRGVSKDYYNGLSFKNTRGGSRYLFIDPRFVNLRKNALVENKPSESIDKKSSLFTRYDIDVKLYTNSQTTLFVPAYLRSLSTNADMIPYFNRSGEVFITRNIMAEDAYKLQAPILEGGDNNLGALIDSSSSDKDDYYEEIKSIYTQLPSHLEPAIYELAKKISGSSTHPYEQALAIMYYLKNNYTYTLDVSEVPKNIDFVSYFLLKTKQGYCSYFASSMTVLARMMGLPARYVEGFVANPDASGIARVTGQNAHAWTEVYFKGFGWVPFDATGGSTENDDNNNNYPPPPPNDEENNEDEPSPSPSPSPSPKPPMPSPEQQDTPQPSPQTNQDNTNTQDNKNNNIFKKILLLLLIIIFLACCYIYIYFTQPDRRAQRQGDIKRAIMIYAEGIMCILSGIKGIDKMSKTSTIYEYILGLEGSKAIPISLIPFANALNKAIYSNSEDLSREFEMSKLCYNSLYNSLKPLAKLRAILLISIFAFSKKEQFIK